MAARRAGLLVLGTSPLAMLRALQLARQGCAVTLVDRGATPGGAWVTPHLLGFDTVENGVHLIENRRALYATLATELGIEMEADAGRSFGLWRGQRIGCSWSRVVLHGLGAAKALRCGSTDRARRAWQSTHRAVANLRVPFAYPAAGCAAIVRGLVAQLHEAGATFLPGVEVDGFATDGGAPVVCRTSAGVVVAEQVLLTSRAHAPVQFDGMAWPFEVEQNDCVSIVLHLSTEECPTFNYVEVIGDAVVKRVRDVGRFAEPRPAAGDRLLCVQVRTPWADSDNDGMVVAGHLRRLGLLPHNFQVRAATTQRQRQRTIPDVVLRRLEQRGGGRILVLPTTDLAEGYVSMVRNSMGEQTGLHGTAA